jgi:methylated-DNA-[protein]-cysteine S-methyltransferase
MPETLHLLIDHIATPIGELAVVADGDGRLRWVDWTEHDGRMPQLLRRLYRVQELSLTPAANPGGISAALSTYFSGKLAAIDRLPVAMGGTAFQRAVWQKLREIPCGETLSYGALARHIGRPDAVRAVGHANGSNPISIVVPCHRVIGSNGSLTGYGGGIERKRWLLAHEGAAALRRIA